MSFSALLSTILLVGCGGGGGSESGNKAPAKVDHLNTDSSGTGKTLKVTAIDGYLKNAWVCLDVNNNQKCDDSDPHSDVGTDKGEYNLLIPSDIKAEDHKIIVKVIEGKTTDMDLPSERLKSYSMTAPQGRTTITPITTLIDFKMKSKQLSLNKARAVVVKSLGLPQHLTLKDLLGDYIVNKDKNSQQLRLVAKKIAHNTELISKLAAHDKETDSKVDALEQQMQEMLKVIESQRVAIEALAQKKAEKATITKNIKERGKEQQSNDKKIQTVTAKLTDTTLTTEEKATLTAQHEALIVDKKSNAQVIVSLNNNLKAKKAEIETAEKVEAARVETERLAKIETAKKVEAARVETERLAKIEAAKKAWEVSGGKLITETAIPLTWANTGGGAITDSAIQLTQEEIAENKRFSTFESKYPSLYSGAYALTSRYNQDIKFFTLKLDVTSSIDVNAIDSSISIYKLSDVEGTPESIAQRQDVPLKNGTHSIFDFPAKVSTNQGGIGKIHSNIILDAGLYLIQMKGINNGDSSIIEVSSPSLIKENGFQPLENNKKYSWSEEGVTHWFKLSMPINGEVDFETRLLSYKIFTQDLGVVKVPYGGLLPLPKGEYYIGVHLSTGYMGDRQEIRMNSFSQVDQKKTEKLQLGNFAINNKAVTWYVFDVPKAQRVEFLTTGGLSGVIYDLDGNKITLDSGDSSFDTVASKYGAVSLRKGRYLIKLRAGRLDAYSGGSYRTGTLTANISAKSSERVMTAGNYSGKNLVWYKFVQPNRGLVNFTTNNAYGYIYNDKEQAVTSDNIIGYSSNKNIMLAAGTYFIKMIYNKNGRVNVNSGTLTDLNSLPALTSGSFHNDDQGVEAIKWYHLIMPKNGKVKFSTIVAIYDKNMNPVKITKESLFTLTAGDYFVEVDYKKGMLLTTYSPVLSEHSHLPSLTAGAFTVANEIWYQLTIPNKGGINFSRPVEVFDTDLNLVTTSLLEKGIYLVKVTKGVPLTVYSPSLQSADQIGQLTNETYVKSGGDNFIWRSLKIEDSGEIMVNAVGGYNSTSNVFSQFVIFDSNLVRTERNAQSDLLPNQPVHFFLDPGVYFVRMNLENNSFKVDGVKVTNNSPNNKIRIKPGTYFGSYKKEYLLSVQADADLELKTGEGVTAQILDENDNLVDWRASKSIARGEYTLKVNFGIKGEITLNSRGLTNFYELPELTAGTLYNKGIHLYKLVVLSDSKFSFTMKNSSVDVFTKANFLNDVSYGSRSLSSSSSSYDSYGNNQDANTLNIIKGEYIVRLTSSNYGENLVNIYSTTLLSPNKLPKYQFSCSDSQHNKIQWYKIEMEKNGSLDFSEGPMRNDIPSILYDLHMSSLKIVTGGFGGYPSVSLGAGTYLYKSVRSEYSSNCPSVSYQ